MDLALAYAEIVKSSKQPDGTMLVHGLISDDTLDLDQQRCDPEWLKTAVPDWFKIGNIREQHDSKRAAGKATEHEANGTSHTITAKIVDPVAVTKVDHGVYTGFSIGVKNPQISKAADAPNGRISGGQIIEVSLVDRPCNPNARLTLVKAAEPGWSGSPADLDEERGLVRCEEITDEAAGEKTTAPDTNTDSAADGEAPANTDGETVTSGDTTKTTDTGQDTAPDNGGDTAPAPEFDADTAKALVADVLKADAATDIADAKRAIEIIGGLIASEASDLSTNPSQTYDIRLLLDAVTALRSFIHCEQAEARPDYISMAADAATEAADADLQKTTTPDTPGTTPDATKATVTDGGGTLGAATPDLVKALTEALGEDDHPLRKMLVSITEDSANAAAQAVSDDLTARLEKVEQMAVQVGPSVRRTETDQKAATLAHLTGEAQHWRRLEESAEDPLLRDSYRLKRAQAEARVKAL